MKKNIFKIIIIFLLIILIKELFLNFYYDYGNRIEVSSYYNNDTSFNYKSDMVINIPKINLDAVVKKTTDNFSNLNKNLVYYNNDNYKKGIIIFGHSGVGYGTYFNRLDELSINDFVYLYKDKLKIKYVVSKVWYVKDDDISVIDINKKETLRLITCKKNDNKKRLVVELSLKSAQTLKK